MSFGFESTIRYSEIGEDKLLSIPSLVDYFQDCVAFQSESLGQGPLQPLHQEDADVWKLRRIQLWVRVICCDRAAVFRQC